MAEIIVRTGRDSSVHQDKPTTNYNATRFLRVRDGEAEALVFLPLSPAQIDGKTVLSATLSAGVEHNWIAQTVSVRALAASWNVDRVNWNNKPGVTGATASVATGALAAGGRFTVDVTALVQAIADGDPNYGWKITTSQGTANSTIRGFDSGYASFVLDIEVADIIARPTTLSPEGVIGAQYPVLSVDDYDDLAEIQVQIDPAANGAAPAFTSAWTATTRPRFVTNGSGYTGLADGATTYWRARVRTINGSTSPYSPWAEITRDAKPALIMDTPSGNELYDPSPRILAHLDPAGDAETRWRVRVYGRGGTLRYDSGDAVEGATLDLTIPWKWTVTGWRVFDRDGGDYTLDVRAWDRMDRVPSPGDPTYVADVREITVDIDGDIDAPTNLVVTQSLTGYPDNVLTWETASDPDYFQIRRNGLFLFNVDPDEARIAPGVFQWPDETAEPNVEHTYHVRATTIISNEPRQSPNSNAETVFSYIEGVWLRSDFGDVVLAGDGIDDFRQVDKRQTFELPYRAEDVDIVTAIGGYEGEFEGFLDQREDQDVDEARAILEQLRETPTAEVRLVWATQNRWVHLRGLSVAPHSSIFPDADRTHVVTFGFFEIDPRD